MEIELVLAEQSDLKKIVETYNSTISSRLATADLEPVSVESKQLWFDAHKHQYRPIFNIMMLKNYIGWMSFSSFYGRPAYNGTAEISIYLNEEYRGKGLGKICLKKAIELAPSLKIHSLLGFIFGHNTQSLKLFYEFGFKDWGRLPEVADMDGKMCDLIIVGLKV